MARISGLLYDDNNINGIYEQNTDLLVANKEVTLRDAGGNAISTTTTDSNGRYTFDNISGGDYLVSYTPGPGIRFSPKGAGSDNAIDSDVNDNGFTDTISIGDSDNFDGINIGCYKLGRIGDKVFEDTNNNGLQDDGEAGVGGVEVLLQDSQGTTVRTATTNDAGNYEFDIVEPGDYQVTFVAPDGREFTTPNAGDDAIDSDADPNTGATDVFNLNFGENKVTVDAGLKGEGSPVEAASLGDRVFFDENGNDLDDGEPGVPNAVVILVDTNGTELRRTTTNDNGNYLFSDLEPGSYRVQFETPDGFDGFTTRNAGNDDAIDSDPNVNGLTDVVSLESGENDLTVDAGVVRDDAPVDQNGSVGDTVFSDLNGDGVQDANEPGVSGVTVTLQNPDGSVVASDTTDDSGIYGFDDVAPGDYKVTVSNVPDGSTFSPANQGGNDATDSDINPDGMSDVFSVAPNEAKDDVDAGLVPDAPAEQTASLGDRVFDDVNGNGLQDAGEPGISGVTVQLQTPEGQTLETDTTDGQGIYGFDNLTPGDYKINLSTPAGFDGFSPQNIGSNEAADSDINPSNGMSDIVSLAAGENNPNLDAGVIKNPEEQTASLGDRVFDDVNGNGLQDAGEPGISGVTVQLQTPEGQTLETDTTDGQGIYGFDNLTPGDYKINLSTPAGFDGFSPQNIGSNEAADSDINPSNGMSDIVSLAAGENNPNLDAGAIRNPEEQTASLGDRVFDDVNGNGIQDAGEQGVAGVPVTVEDRNGVVQTITTDANGIYTADGLTPGDYKITVDAPDGSDFSPANQGTNDAADSDVDPGTGMSDFVTLAAGQNLDTLDAGLIDQPEQPQTASLGDRVFNDANGNGIQDAGEQGVAGVPVTVEDRNGVVQTITTDANGIYTADGLTPDDYKITVDAPDGSDFSPANQGTDDAADSDVDPGTGMSDFVTLAAGQNLDTLDAGLIDQPDPVDINPSVDIEKLVRVEGEGGQEGVDLCSQFGDPVGLVFEYVAGASVNSTAQSIATVEGPAIGDSNVEVLSIIPGVADPVVFVGGTGKGKGKGKAGKGLGKAGKAGKGKGGILNPFPNPNPNPAPTDPDGTPIALGNTFVVRPDGLDTLNLEVEGASGTQAITYDASCNSPIRLGDQIGNLRLVGFEGTNGSTSLGGGSTTDVDADDAPGVDALVGNNIVFTYTVSNDGDTPLRLDSVTDDRLGNPTLVGGDDNSNGLLDLNEVFTYTANEAAGSGLQTNIGTVNATAVDANGNPVPVTDGSGGAVVTVTDSDPANYTGVNQITPIEVPNTEVLTPNPNPPTPQGDLCEVLGKPSSLTFVYRPSNGVNTLQEKFELDGFADDDNVAFIVGGGGKGGKGGKGKGGFTGGISGGQQVSTGETITVGVSGSSTDIAIADDQGEPVIQTVDYHTSCSDIIQLGDQIGSLTLVGYNGEDGSFALTQEQIDSLPLV